MDLAQSLLIANIASAGKKVKYDVTAGGPGSGRKPDDDTGFDKEPIVEKKHKLLEFEDAADDEEVDAGGPGSGRKPGAYNENKFANVVSILKSKGFSEIERKGRDKTKEGADFQYHVSSNQSSPGDTAYSENHGVHVAPDGSWSHTEDNSHEGTDAKGLETALGSYFLKFAAGGPGSGRHPAEFSSNKAFKLAALHQQLATAHDRVANNNSADDKESFNDHMNQRDTHDNIADEYKSAKNADQFKATWSKAQDATNLSLATLGDDDKSSKVLGRADRIYNGK